MSSAAVRMSSKVIRPTLNNLGRQQASKILLRSFTRSTVPQASVTASLSNGLNKVSAALGLSSSASAFQIPDSQKKTLVIVGSGWGSTGVLQNIDASKYNIVLVSQRDFFLFTPLLPSTPVGTVEHRSIIEPVHNIIKKQGGKIKFYEAEATAVNTTDKTVSIKSVNLAKPQEFDIKYDYLVMGVGAQVTTFGIPGVAEHAYFLKELEDSKKLRARITSVIEEAQFITDAAARKKLLNFVVVGGGPTGVEFAAELQDFINEDLSKTYPELAKEIKVSLVEALPNVLNMFGKQNIKYTQDTFRDIKIDLLTKTMVKNVTADKIDAVRVLDNGEKEAFSIEYGTLVWATGNAVRPLTKSIMASVEAQKEARRGLIVNDFLAVEGTQDMWALGDCSATKYAPTAQVALQEGKYLASVFSQLGQVNALEVELKNLEASLKTENDTEKISGLKGEIESKTRTLEKNKLVTPFEYNHQGAMAYIGNERAVFDLALYAKKIYPLSGRTAFVIWMGAYNAMCITARTKTLVAFDWLKTRTFGRDITRE
ncbi:alternative NADH-dehydrogenase [Nadsonia fulvescens var. elongata DSM 6958]|uniref:NADH:ubiquinone reductase (non-electrogenic) n=1 Tax=Nadsonia fulvescens var. elongata DSM 6958 TaxID=857566 RepID=A0A1E3PKG2_9ASCO|nr:alternative NADH-dehydrogenase [Nadsonia fulvescens var. elongata DSM 6958]